MKIYAIFLRIFNTLSRFILTSLDLSYLSYLDFSSFIISWFILISLDFFSLQIWSAMCAYCLSRFLNGALQRAEGTQTCQRARGHFWKEIFVSKNPGVALHISTLAPLKSPLLRWSVEVEVFLQLNGRFFATSISKCLLANIPMSLLNWTVGLRCFFVCAGSIHRHTTMRLVSLSEIFSITGRPRSCLVDLLLKRKTLKKKLI